ncbi:PP2C family protein-serine/threonine phosphatase [Streptomyces sp. NPDC015131]|uniref:PP2C family protein-serine/threonine phosphatase n=1 Tax=Streptomyces sp. NPDC015131 TaxID=3364941 RepID=UPI0036F62F54
MPRYTLSTLTELRRTARGIALSHRLTAEHRARLVLSLSEASAPALSGGQAVTVTVATGHRSAGSEGTALLVITLRAPVRGTGAWREPERLPLPGRADADGSLVWSLPVDGRPARVPPSRTPPLPRPADPPAPARPAGDVTDHSLLEEELREAMARADALAAEHRRLEHELAATNNGVMALFVQLEERDEHLRRAHGRTLRALEDALRPRPLEVAGLELAVHYAPAGVDDPTGGDLYDWFALPDGTVHITVVDALGHGVTSTRTALTVTHAVRTLVLEGHPLDTIVERTDRLLTPFDPRVMATVLLARLDPRTGDLRLANGSHPPALLVRPDGTAEFLEVRGRGIGYPKPGSERVLRTRLHRGDLLVLYTDGLTENRRDLRRGEQLLLQSARRHRRESTARIPGAIAAELLTRVLHHDDTLALAVRLV